MHSPTHPPLSILVQLGEVSVSCGGVRLRLFGRPLMQEQSCYLLVPALPQSLMGLGSERCKKKKKKFGLTCTTDNFTLAMEDN